MDMAAPDPLRAIRDSIDRIDAEMHRLLIERSGVIAELIRIKGASGPGGAFRPDREADMMRRLAMRHSGDLPLATVEHIWREIITTFTAMQAPFGLAVGPAPDPLAMRDLVRFYFGFSIPVTDCPTAEEAIGRVAASTTDIAVVPASSGGRWWSGLESPAAPTILAKLPFLDIPSRPASLPAYVIGPPLRERAHPDIGVYACKDAPELAAAVDSYGGAIAARAGGEILFELPIAAEPDDVARAAGMTLGSARPLGGFHQPIRFMAERVA